VSAVSVVGGLDVGGVHPFGTGIGYSRSGSTWTQHPQLAGSFPSGGLPPKYCHINFSSESRTVSVDPMAFGFNASEGRGGSTGLGPHRFGASLASRDASVFPPSADDRARTASARSGRRIVVTSPSLNDRDETDDGDGTDDGRFRAADRREQSATPDATAAAADGGNHSRHMLPVIANGVVLGGPSTSASPTGGASGSQAPRRGPASTTTSSGQRAGAASGAADRVSGPRAAEASERRDFAPLAPAVRLGLRSSDNADAEAHKQVELPAYLGEPKQIGALSARITAAQQRLDGQQREAHYELPQEQRQVHVPAGRLAETRRPYQPVSEHVSSTAPLTSVDVFFMEQDADALIADAIAAKPLAVGDSYDATGDGDHHAPNAARQTGSGGSATASGIVKLPAPAAASLIVAPAVFHVDTGATLAPLPSTIASLTTASSKAAPSPVRAGHLVLPVSPTRRPAALSAGAAGVRGFAETFPMNENAAHIPSVDATVAYQQNNDQIPHKQAGQEDTPHDREDEPAPVEGAVDVFADGAIDDILDSYYHDRALLLEEYGVPLEQNDDNEGAEIARAVGALSDRNQEGSSAGPGDAAGATSSSNGERQAAAFARSMNTTGPSPIVDAALPQPPLGKGGAVTTTSPVALVSIESSATTTTPLLPMKEDQLPKQQPNAPAGAASMGFATSTPKHPGEGETRAVAAAMRERGAYLGRDHIGTVVAPAPLTPVSDVVALTPMEEENNTRGSSPTSGVHHDNFGEEAVNFGGAIVVDHMRVPTRGAQPPYHEYLDLERPQRARSMSVSLSEPSMVSSMATGPAPFFT
jgi:hypothetical protein